MISSRRNWIGRNLVGLCSAPLAASFAYGQEFSARRDLDDLYDQAVDEAVRGGLEYLLAQHNDDGSFQTAEQGRWVGVCALAGLAMLSRGVRPGIGAAGLAVRRIGQYILQQAQGSGFISSGANTSHGPMYDHGFGTLFLAEMLGMDNQLDIRPKLSAAVKLIRDTQNKQGGWRYNPAPDDADLSVTVCQMMALRAARNAGLGVPQQTIQRAIHYVRQCQNPDGGFMYQTRGGESRFPLTAAAIVALYSAGVYEGSEIESAFAYLLANISLNNSLERNNFFFYAHYYSAQAFWLRGGSEWEPWYKRLKRTILGLRTSRGGWFDYNSSEYGTAMACLILNMPRTVLPIFQR
ncbi:MAG: terpene cyclase/mutase family protein [Pirellulaceae bacterium]|nr:terpene cyclase/mutase family protein [Pirellulaceae bacterium]